MSNGACKTSFISHVMQSGKTDSCMMHGMLVTCFTLGVLNGTQVACYM